MHAQVKSTGQRLFHVSITELRSKGRTTLILLLYTAARKQFAAVNLMLFDTHTLIDINIVQLFLQNKHTANPSTKTYNQEI